MWYPPRTSGDTDFFGSHMIRQVFYFIRPTPANLAAYERWSGTEMQSHAWLGDMCDEVFKVELNSGNTMIIPTGWIHAVVSMNITAQPMYSFMFACSTLLRTHWYSEAISCTRIMSRRVS